MHTLSGGSVSTPRRQSCDRCHGQKLRCPRPPNGNSGACERCIRSKAQCVYSSSLPKGRPSSYRQNRQNTNAPNVKLSAGSDKATSGGIDFGVENNVYSAVTETTIVEEQHFDPTTTASWDNLMAIDCMEYIDNTFQESDQWLPEFQNKSAGWAADFGDNAIDPSFAPDLANDVSAEPMQQVVGRADSHQSSTPRKEEPETAVASLSRLSQRLYSLYSAVLEMVNPPGALDQADTITLHRGPFADDSAFQTLTGWLVQASSNTVDPSVRAGNQENGAHTAGQDGCTLLHDVFSASRDMLNTLHSLNDESLKYESSVLGAAETDCGVISPAAARANGPSCGTGKGLSFEERPGSGHWSNSIVRHMVMACHMLLLNTYLAVTMALQHELDKQTPSQGASSAQALPLGEVRTVMIVQLCGYLIQRQAQAVQVYLAPPSPTHSGDDSTLHNINPLSSSDQAATKQLEKDVEQRLARLRQSLHV